MLATLDNPVRTKIVATVGPATESVAALEQLLRAGVDVFRLNFAHGTYEWHSETVRRIREVSATLARPVAILQDLAGPKIRLGELPGGALQSELGQRYVYVRTPTDAPNELTLSYPDLIDDVELGESLLLADGNVAMRAVAKQPGRLEAEVTLPGEIRSRQGVNLPGSKLKIGSLTDKDIRDLDWTARHPIDFVGMSFVRQAADVERLRAELQKRGSTAQIIAKIEKPEAAAHLDAIITATDAVMVARGDLGVEIDVATVPMVQKEIITRCHSLGVPVITATQMLESMRQSNRPTRAEATDVANAILDGTDAVMLSAETATGAYPVAAVEMMNRIARETESKPLARAALQRVRELPALRQRDGAAQVTQAMVEAAGRIADAVQPRVIVAATQGGHTALALALQRLQTPVLGLSDVPETVRRMCLYWGVLPAAFSDLREPTEYVSSVTAWAIQQRIVQPGDRLLFVFGSHWAAGHYNALLLHQA